MLLVAPQRTTQAVGDFVFLTKAAIAKSATEQSNFHQKRGVAFTTPHISRTMHIRLLKDTFFTQHKGTGYIANTSTGHSMLLDETGALWTSKLTYILKSFEKYVDSIRSYYYGIEEDVLRKDIYEFIDNLKQEGYISVEEIPPFKSLILELTKKCNEKCIHCYIPNSYKDIGVDLDLHTYKQVVDDFIEMGGESIFLTGGEPMMSKNFIQLLEYALSTNLKITILTNALKLNDQLFSLLSHNKIETVQISLYSTNSHTHDSITGVKGSCHKTMEAIEKLHASNINVKIACIAVKENYNEVCDVFRFAEKLGVDYGLDMSIFACFDKTTDNLVHRVTLEELEFMINDIYDFDQDFCKSLLQRNQQQYDENYNFLNFLNKPLCEASYEKLYITSNGDVSLCPNWQQIVIGNIKKEKLKNIWENSEYINTIRIKRESDFPKCISCEASDYCLKCMSRNYTESGSIDVFPEIYCKQAFLYKRLYEKYFDNDSK